jgi:hypothetical protein
MYFYQPSQINRSKSRPWLALVCTSLAISIATCSTPIALSQPTPSTSAKKGAPAPAVIQSIRQAIKKQFKVSQITVVSATEQKWPDGCLGLPGNQEICTQAIVLGWRVEVSDNLQTWVYRSDSTGKTLRLENPDRSVLSPTVASKLIQQVAQETKTLPAKLRISAVKAQVFGGCLGIYRPHQPCTRIAIKGWQAIINSPNKTFVYHLNQNATRIEQNNTASGASQKIRVSFDTFGEIAPIATNEIFRSSTSGDFTGKMISTVLTEDGKITLYQSSPLAKFAPVVIRTLSARQAKAFKRMLEDLQFPNFNGLSYLTSAALADYPTTTYQSQSAATQFIDLEKQSLPRSLQALITSWELLTRSK